MVIKDPWGGRMKGLSNDARGPYADVARRMGQTAIEDIPLVAQTTVPFRDIPVAMSTASPPWLPGIARDPYANENERYYIRVVTKLMDDKRGLESRCAGLQGEVRALKKRLGLPA